MINRTVKLIPPLCVAIFATIKWSGLIESFQIIQWAAAFLWIFAAFITFCLLHIVKFFRFYFILLEAKIHLNLYVRLYLQTTLVSILIPFKLGEIFRFYLVGKKLRSYRLSLLSIITERFFDTCIIVIIMLVHILFIHLSITESFLFFLFFIFGAFSIYILYPSFSLFMNKFIIFKRAKAYDLTALSFLNMLDSWHNYEKSLIHKKGYLVFFCSAISWFIEYFFLYSLAKICSVSFDLSLFYNYINDIFSATLSLPIVFFNLYAIISILVLAGAYVSAIVLKYFLRGNVKWEK